MYRFWRRPTARRRACRERSSSRWTFFSQTVSWLLLGVYRFGLERSLTAKKRNEVGDLRVGQTDGETRVVELDDIGESRGRPVMKVRRARGEAPQNRTLELSDIAPLAGDERAARVSGLDRLTCRRVLERVQRQVRSPARSIGQTNVEWCWHGVIAHVRRVVAGAAEAVDGLHAEHIVQSLHADDVDSPGVEKLLAASHRGARCVAPSLTGLGAVVGKAQPGVEVSEYDRAEHNSPWILTHRIV